MNKRDLVKAHLEKYGKINTWEAITLYGQTRLSDTIYALRKQGYNITNTWEKDQDRFGNPCKYVTYRLEA